MQKQILIVEDNELNRTILCEILSSDYQVLEAANGQEALDILQQRKDKIALILLDVMMPVMDGYTFLDRLKDDPELSLTPVIVMTQGDSEVDEVTALAHGATDFVPKPYRPQVILHRAASLIKLRETAAMVNQFKYDRLTGLYSKEYFYQKAHEWLLENPDQDYCIVCANIENFKLVNDAFGSQEGDRLLKEMAAVVQKMAGSDGLCGRFTADRFLFLQKRQQEYQNRLNFGNHPELELSPLLKSVVMRWGIYEIADRSIPVEQMCDRALLAADSIRGQYNQYIAVYDDSLRSRLLREKAITDAMETALAEEQFTVYFQPKYSLSRECLAGAEALVRWIHPQWGFMSPGEFIPLFEKNGFIPKLDRYVWERVCAQLHDWQERGYPLLPISVNVSRADVYQVNLVDTLLGLTQEYGIDPAYLHLEITESAYSEHPGQIISTVEKLRKAGFVIEMDDFGSGYSSLNMLSQMKLDILKLDMKFIQNEIAKPTKQSILNDVIAMAHRLNLRVVAEGVETQEQMNRLQEVGCDYVQGYFFAKPMQSADYEKLMRACRCPTTDSGEPLRNETDRCELLVVDENPGYRTYVRQILDKQYCVLEAADGESTLDCIRSRGAHGICAVILSMTLPENGAASVLKVLRQEPAYWQIPVLSTIPSGEKMKELPLALESDDFLCKCHPLFDLRRRIQRLVEAAAFHRRERFLQDEANRDHLTGLLNRRGLHNTIAQLEGEDLPLAVYLFDLDDLKRMNDTFGHDAGDQMLRAFADLLRRKTCGGDILCRYGGDEFLVILKKIHSLDTILRKGRNICQEFHDFHLPDGSRGACSGGVALCGPNETLSEEIIRRADAALYKAKHMCKGTCCLWEDNEKNPAMTEASDRLERFAEE